MWLIGGDVVSVEDASSLMPAYTPAKRVNRALVSRKRKGRLAMKRRGRIGPLRLHSISTAESVNFIETLKIVDNERDEIDIKFENKPI